MENNLAEKIVYVGGTFDLFHRGHANFLRQCAKLGKVVVALNTDEFVARYKGKPPVMNYKEREGVLLACRYVSEVIPNSDGEDSKPTISAVLPNFIAIGSDWAKKDYYKQMNFTQEWLDMLDITLVYLAYTGGISSTDIRKRLK